ncbi:MAG: Serine/threonine protein kinase, partial [Myxococcaceae bacterium]|nr:Serine/threonine protein kinase [Myxococcaceae bacterium]
QVHRHLLGRPDCANFFRHDARLASLIHHANVVPVIDVVEAPGELLLVMEYVESVSLSLLRSTANKAGVVVPPPIVFRIFLDMLAGLHAAHDLVDGEGRPLDVVHRDVSPQNVIVGVDGVSRLIDFGVAKASHRLTESESGDIKGKYAYMSPEQVAGLPVGRRSDVFAASVVLFETLTGVRLFAGEHAMDTLRRVVDESLPDLRAFPNIPVELHEVFARGLAKEASQRIASAAELAEAIESRVPAASHRRVGEWVTQQCGALLAERRVLLEESRRSGLTRSGENAALAAEDTARSTRQDDHTTQVQWHGPPSSPVPASHQTSVASVSDMVPRTRRRGPMLVSIALGVVVAGLLVLTAWTMRQRERPVAAASGTQTASAAQTASPSPMPSASIAPGGSGGPPSLASTEPTTKKPTPARRAAPPPRPDDLQGDPYGSK